MSAKRTTLKTGERWYTWRGEKYWSVTTMLKAYPKQEPLKRWAANEVANYVCQNLSSVAPLIEKDPDAAYDVLRGVPFKKQKKAADLGSTIHAAAEAYVLGKPFPPYPLLAKPRMKAFEQFLADHDPEFEMVEAPVYNRTERYAGTLDAIATIDGRKLLIDTKTGAKGPYPEVALQLAAYRFAEFRGLPDGSESPMPEVDGCIVLKLTDDGYSIHEVRAGPEIFACFLYVREVYRFQTEISKTVFKEAA